MTLVEKIKKGLISGFNSASDITSEYTKIGRIKIDILGIKKEIEEKFLELGGKIYHSVTVNNSISGLDESHNNLINEIKNLENELKRLEQELKKLKKLEDTVFIQK